MDTLHGILIDCDPANLLGIVMGTGRYAGLAVLALMLVVFIYLLDRINSRVRVLDQKLHLRLKLHLSHLGDPTARRRMAQEFAQRYSTKDEDRSVEEPWATLQNAIETDLDSLMKNDETFACAVAFLGEGLREQTNGTWDAIPWLDVSDQSSRKSSRTLGRSSLIDVALILGQAMERKDLTDDIEIFNMILEDRR